MRLTGRFALPLGSLGSISEHTPVPLTPPKILASSLRCNRLGLNGVIADNDVEVDFRDGDNECFDGSRERSRRQFRSET
jgi:hypothetical protein